MVAVHPEPILLGAKREDSWQTGKDETCVTLFMNIIIVL